MLTSCAEKKVENIPWCIGLKLNFLKGRSSAHVYTNPNQTPTLLQLIKVFKTTRDY